MENEKKINLHVEKGIAEVIFREGQALAPVAPEKVNITGTICAPADYHKVRTDQVDVMKAVVLYSYDGMFIKLDLDPKDPYADKVTGKLEPNPIIAAFGINTQKKYVVSDLISFLKMNRSYFKDKETCLSMVANLQRFKANVQVQLEKNDDNRGNKKNLVETTVTTDIPMNFTLKFPLFKGGDDFSFQVDICFEARDAGLTLWLESVELAEFIQETRRKLIDDQVAEFPGFVVIQTV